MQYQTCKLKLSTFSLLSGCSFDDVDVCYTIYGSLENNKKLALFFHGFSGSSELHTWWNGLKICELLKNYNIICINSLGSSHGTMGPDSIIPKSNLKWGGEFPKITIQDMVTFSLCVLKELNISKVDLVFGCSLGGMQVLDMYLRYPEFGKKFVSVAGAPVSRVTRLMNLAQARLIDNAAENNEALMEHALGISRIFFRLVCTTEKALSKLEFKLTPQKIQESDNVLYDYFVNDSVKFQGGFSPYSNSLYLKLISNFNTSTLNLKKHVLSKKPITRTSIDIVSISSDAFVSKESETYIFKLLEKNGHDVNFYKFNSVFGHEAWIVDGEKFYEFSKNNNLF